MIRVDEIMTRDPACCTPGSTLQDVARKMVEHDCGEIPICRSESDGHVVGVVTDRDIVVRLVAEGRNPVQLTASACMTTPAVTVRMGTSLEECLELMEARQIRRIPVVDAEGRICGIVSQADIAKHASDASTADLVKEVSEAPKTRAAGQR